MLIAQEYLALIRSRKSSSEYNCWRAGCSESCTSGSVRVPFGRGWKSGSDANSLAAYPTMALDEYLEEFAALFFPEAHADIDWSRPVEFLDKELQQVALEAETGRRFADKLAKVWRKSGEQGWVLAHVEVQGKPEEHFDLRVYTYNHRLFEIGRAHV